MHVRLDVIRQRIVHPETPQLFLDDLVLEFATEVKGVDATLELLAYVGLANDVDVKDRQAVRSGQTECSLDDLLYDHASGQQG